jgi:hypothetical protein
MRVIALPILLATLWATTATAQPIFTGHANLDFDLEGAVHIDDPGGVDVGVPSSFPPGTISGMDVKTLHACMDDPADGGTLYLALETYGIAGDLDGNGDPSGTAAWLTATGGVDLPDFSGAEHLAIRIDLDGDAKPEIVIGVSPFVGLSQVGLFEWLDSGLPGGLPGGEFGAALDNWSVEAAYFPEAGRPHLEFSIGQFQELLGITAGDGAKTIGLGFEIGSLTGGGVGSDVLLNTSAFLTPCVQPEPVEPMPVEPPPVEPSPQPEPSLPEPSAPEPNIAEPNLAEPNLAEPNLAEPNLAEPGPDLVEPKPTLPPGPAGPVTSVQGGACVVSPTSGLPGGGQIALLMLMLMGICSIRRVGL